MILGLRFKVKRKYRLIFHASTLFPNFVYPLKVGGELFEDLGLDATLTDEYRKGTDVSMSVST